MRLLTQNLGWKLFSLLVAVLLWISVASEPELSTFAGVPVEFKDMPQGLEIGAGLVESVHLEMRGPSGELRSFGDSKTAVVLDMSQVRRGTTTFSIGPHNVKLPRGIHLIRAIPSEIRLEFEHRLARNVPVEARFTENPQPGYEVARWEVIPPALTIVGPESRVNRVRSVVTDPIRLGGIVGSEQFRINAFVDDPYVRFQTSPQVVVTVTMEKH